MALRGLSAPKPKESGSGIGDVVGTILGGIAGAAAIIGTGGAAAPAVAGAAGVGAGAAGASLGSIAGGAITGMGVGGKLGGIAGGLARPAEEGPKQTPQMDSMQRRQQDIENSPLGQLTQAHQASLELPPELQEQVQAPLKLAMQRVQAQQAQGVPKYGA